MAIRRQVRIGKHWVDYKDVLAAQREAELVERNEVGSPGTELEFAL